MKTDLQSFWDEVKGFEAEASKRGLVPKPKMGGQPAEPEPVAAFVSKRREPVERKLEAAAISPSEAARRRDRRFFALVGLSFSFLVVVLVIVLALRGTTDVGTILGAGGGVLASFVTVLTGFVSLEQKKGANDLEALRLDGLARILPSLDDECFLKVVRELHYRFRNAPAPEERASRPLAGPAGSGSAA
jgi:hypothetical protein